MSRRTPIDRRTERGISLVEVMVTLVVTLVVLAGSRWVSTPATANLGDELMVNAAALNIGPATLIVSVAVPEPTVTAVAASVTVRALLPGVPGVPGVPGTEIEVPARV